MEQKLCSTFLEQMIAGGNTKQTNNQISTNRNARCSDHKVSVNHLILQGCDSLHVIADSANRNLCIRIGGNVWPKGEVFGSTLGRIDEPELKVSD